MDFAFLWILDFYGFSKNRQEILNEFLSILSVFKEFSMSFKRFSVGFKRIIK